MPINSTLATDSNIFIVLALVTYTVAFFAYCAEWAFGSRDPGRRVVTAVGNSVRVATQRRAGSAAQVQVPAVVSVAVAGGGGGSAGSGGVTVLTRALAEDAEPRLAGSSPRAEMMGRFALMAFLIGFGFHAAGVVARGLAAHRVPWANMYEFSCAVSLAMAGSFVVLLATRRGNARWLGLPVSFVVLITLGIAYTLLYAPAEELVPALDSYWLYIHVTAAMLSTGAFGVATVATTMYLVKAAVEEGKLPRLAGVCNRLPSSVALDRMSYRVVAFTFPLWTFAVIAGAIWAEKAWGRYWGWDPKETWSFIVWVVYAAYLHARATHGWKGKAAAWIAMTAFACVLVNYFVVNTLIAGHHSYAGL